MRRPPQFCRNTAREHATEEDAKKLLSTVQTAVQAPKMKIKKTVRMFTEKDICTVIVRNLFPIT